MVYKLNKKEALLRSETIRKQNLQRHAKSAGINKLRNDILRASNVRQMQMERDRLLEASLRPRGLNSAGLERMNELETFLFNKKDEHRGTKKT